MGVGRSHDGGVGERKWLEESTVAKVSGDATCAGGRGRVASGTRLTRPLRSIVRSTAGL